MVCELVQGTPLTARCTVLTCWFFEYWYILYMLTSYLYAVLPTFASLVRFTLFPFLGLLAVVLLAAVFKLV